MKQYFGFLGFSAVGKSSSLSPISLACNRVRGQIREQLDRSLFNCSAQFGRLFIRGSFFHFLT